MTTKVTNNDTAPVWLEAIKAAPPLLWGILALIIVFEIGPDLLRLVKIAAVTKIGIGAINLELAQRRLGEVRGLDATGIPPAVQVQLKRRFANVADYASEAQILWVDDQNPQQNARERRVLSTLSIPIDLANSTNEALNWLGHADYDIVVTDLTRPRDDSSSCNDDPTAPVRAGCDLIKKIMAGSSKAPAIIVYAGNTEGIVSSKGNLQVTNNPSDLFNAIIDAIERMDRKE
jgi:CheY-like chemotaxis protein